MAKKMIVYRVQMPVGNLLTEHIDEVHSMLKDNVEMLDEGEEIKITVERMTLWQMTKELEASM